MKKFFIFLAIALAFIMLSSTFLSIGKIFDKDPEETEDPGFVTLPGTTTEVPATEDSVFYIDGQAVEDPTDESLNGRLGFFTLNGTAYFGVLVNEDENHGGTVFLSSYDQEYASTPFAIRGTDDFITVHTPTINPTYPDTFSVSDLAPNFDHADGDGEIWFVIIFLDLPANAQNNFELCEYLESYESYDFGFEYSPGEIEGPSAGDVTEPVTTPPQVDPSIPEGPGAEDLPWPEAPGAE